MGVLDELKRQAESRRQQHDAQAQDETQKLDAIEQALTAISRYFNELAASLNVVKPDVARTFVVQGNDCLRGLTQGDYFVRERRKSAEARERFDRVTLHFRATGKEPLQLETYADHATDRLRNYLQAYGLRFETQAFRNDRGVTLKTTITVLPDVPATVAAAADAEAGTIRLKLRNVEAIGDAEYIYHPAEIDRALLDELARLVLGQPNEFRTLGRHQEMLRVRIVARPVERESEPEPQAARPQPKQEPPRARLFGSLKSLWKK